MTEVEVFEDTERQLSIISSMIAKLEGINAAVVRVKDNLGNDHWACRQIITNDNEILPRYPYNACTNPVIWGPLIEKYHIDVTRTQDGMFNTKIRHPDFEGEAEAEHLGLSVCMSLINLSQKSIG